MMSATDILGIDCRVVWLSQGRRTLELHSSQGKKKLGQACKAYHSCFYKASNLWHWMMLQLSYALGLAAGNQKIPARKVCHSRPCMTPS